MIEQFEKLKPQFALTAEQIAKMTEPLEGVGDMIKKLSDVQGITYMPHHKAICGRKSGKFIETPNVKPRATMSQARGIRLCILEGATHR